MNLYARWLFGIAAIFNLLVGLALLFLRASLMRLLDLDAIHGTNLVLANLTGMFIALFGLAYALLAFDPVAWRPLIPLSALGKLFAVVCVVLPWLAGAVPASLPLLVSGDLVFALLFLDYLRRTRAR